MRAFPVVSVVVSVSLVVLIGCASPVLDIPEPGEKERAAADSVLDDTRLRPSRNMTPRERTPTVNRVLGRIRTAAHRVCQSLDLEDDRCHLMRRADVYVYSREAGVNAYADQWNNVGVLGGLVELSGSDGEVAAVLAHELAHIMYGHVGKKFKNALVGAALAGGFTAYAQRRSGYYDNRAVENAMALGATIGSRAYSPEMEIEADRTAIYILREAGFSPTEMRNVIVRMNRVKPAKSRFFGLVPSRVGFLQTHPSNDRRIAHILSAIKDSEAGVPLKVAGR